MIEDIRSAVHAASATDQKIAMFHFQVLRNAATLEGMNARAFCKEVGVPVTYATEFTKMIALARLMGEQGVKLA